MNAPHTGPARLDLEVPREFRSLDLIFERMDGLLADPRVDARSAYVIRLAIEELFTNMVKYSPEGHPTISLSMALENRSMTVRMVDRGVRPFDVTTAVVPDLEMPMEKRRVGGVGLHLVRSLLDGLEYTHESGQTTITLTKNLER